MTPTIYYIAQSVEKKRGKIFVRGKIPMWNQKAWMCSASHVLLPIPTLHTSDNTSWMTLCHTFQWVLNRTVHSVIHHSTELVSNISSHSCGKLWKVWRTSHDIYVPPWGGFKGSNAMCCLSLSAQVWEQENARLGSLYHPGWHRATQASSDITVTPSHVWNFPSQINKTKSGMESQDTNEASTESKLWTDTARSFPPVLMLQATKLKANTF